MARERTLHCPICGKEVALSDPNMPFCGDRCRLLDLGNWASEKYAIPASGVTDFEDEELSEPPQGFKQ